MRRRYKIDILDYVVTSNHIHLLVSSRKGKMISELLNILHMKDDKQFRRWYQATLFDKLEDEDRKRQAFWSKAVAVGDEDWPISEGCPC